MTTAARTRSTTTLRDLVALTKPRITLMVIITTAGGSGWRRTRCPGPRSATPFATAMVVGSANTLNCWVERRATAHGAHEESAAPGGCRLTRGSRSGSTRSAALSVPILTIVANPLTGLLAAVALVSYVMIYTPMKQRSPAALIVGAVPGALPPLMGWTAATGELTSPGIVLFGILFLWQMPHFLAISIFRQTEYEKAGIKVLPSTRGTPVAKRHAMLWAGALVPVSLLLVPLGIAGWLYLAVAGVAGLGFFAWSLAGLRAEAGNRWARQLFLASLVYLPLLFAALAVDVASA
ncbi:MAG: protoheme IX farnesyltransferase [Sandaracinaceae bacterium]